MRRGGRGRARGGEGSRSRARSLAAVRPLVQGIQISTAGGAIEAAIDVIEAVEACDCRRCGLLRSADGYSRSAGTGPCVRT